MSQLKAAKELLDKVHTEYKCVKSALTKCIDGVPTRQKALTSKLQKFDEALQQLNAAHTTWVSKANLTAAQLEANPYSSQWLEEVWGDHTDLQDRADDKLSTFDDDTTPPVPTNKQKLLITNKRMESLQENINSKIAELSLRSSDNATSGSMKVYAEMLSSIKGRLGEEFSQLLDTILTLDVANVDQRLEELEKYRRDHESTIMKIELALANKQSTPNASPAIKGVEMEKSKAPTFSGRTLDYPEFKRGWKKVAGVVWDDGNQVEQIKLKVDAETRRIITRCKNMNDVWQTLDNEFAQEQDVINAVNEELKAIRLTECSSEEYIVQLRNHLPNLEDILQEVNGLEHLQNPDRVSYMAAKFDERIMHEWEYFRSKHKGTTYETFFKFLIDRYDSARSCIARRKSQTLEQIHVVRCSACLQNGHFTNNCPQSQTPSLGNDCKRCNWQNRDNIHTCPGCGRGTPKGSKIGHCLEHCGLYMAMTVDQRSDCVEKSKWCPVHLISTHDLDACNMKNDPRYICGIGGCQKHHHKSLHNSTTPFVAQINSTSSSKASNVLLLAQTVSTVSGLINCFWDNGSTCCLIKKSAAVRLQLPGEPMHIDIETACGKKTLESAAHHVPLVDNLGQTHVITAFSVENISNHLKSIDTTNVKGEFSADMQDKWNLLDRPAGDIEILIGVNHFGLHPCELECVGNLKVMSSQFGTGYILGGFHQSIKSDNVQFDNTVQNIRLSNSHSINAISIQPSYEFFEGDVMGIQPPRRCGSCLKCKECTFRGQQMSQQEQYEYHVIESKVTHVESSQNFHVEYPFTEDPQVLPNNRSQVIKIAERTEKKLIKDGNLGRFNEEFHKMIHQNAIREISPNEMEAWAGPVHYVSLQPVIREDSSTTPVRIVTNSSLSDKRGMSLNSILMKGPNTLSDQWEILNRWRAYEEVVCSDVSKAYWSLRTGELEMHVRRIVWRDGDSSSSWKTYGFLVVSFGDRPAAAILEIAIKKIADLYQSIDPQASQKIKDDRYVDDIATGGDQSQVSRFVGEDGVTTGTMSQILSKGALNLKVVVRSGETDEHKLQKLGKLVLGIGWDPPSDSIYINLTQNLKYPVESLLVCPLTLRLCLSIVNSIYDPLGLATPITIRFKVAFRNLFRPSLNLAWDDPIPSEDQEEWLILLRMIASSNSIQFTRATKPPNANGRCQLICFFDGSDSAYAGVIYSRWVLHDGTVFTNLVNCKSRTTPLHRISTPRSELNGAVIIARLVLSTLRSWPTSDALPEKVWFIGDSECTLSSIEKVTGVFGEFFGNRVGEIQSKQAKIEEYCKVGEDGEWWFTHSKNNGADIATRLDSSCADIGPGTDWQQGPPYLKSPISEWPINRDFIKRKEDFIPQGEMLKKYRCLIQAVNVEEVPGIDKLINPFSTNDWQVLLNKTQLLLLASQTFSQHIGSEISTVAERMHQARILWFGTIQKETEEAMEKGKLRELDVQSRDGLKVVVGRAPTGLQHFFGKDYLPIVMGDTRIAELIMMSAHWKDHAGRDITQALARHEAWIVNSKNLSKKVIFRCIRCRYIRKSLEMQKMAVLPDSVQVQCPPFSNIGLDLCGPFTVKAMTNKRATMKVWIVIFLCLNTKGVSIELAPGYSTKDFLLAYMSHVSTRGSPTLVHSDRGSQLTAAHKEVSDDPLRYNWDEIAASTSCHGTTWNFTPAGGQWRNGAAESFVKKFKHSFHHLYKNTTLNYAELSCAVKRISNILNHRPISVQRTRTDQHDADFLAPLTPNMLLTGRSGSGPPKDYVNETDPHVRQSYLEELERAWWYQYKVQYFESLIPTRKWLEKKRNISPGDVVLIQYKSKTAPGTYRLGRVTHAETDEDDLVRTCTVSYRLVKPVTDKNRDTVTDVTTKEVRVPIQRLVMILPVEEQ